MAHQADGPVVTTFFRICFSAYHHKTRQQPIRWYIAGLINFVKEVKERFFCLKFRQALLSDLVFYVVPLHF